MSDRSVLNVLVFGAHPADPDASAGGVAALWAERGHRVTFVSLTNGDAGHHESGGVALARRRYAETRAVARVLGLAEYLVLDNHERELEPSLANRREVIRIIRACQPDLILTPRSNADHPDYRSTSVLVQDAAPLITVPNSIGRAQYLPRTPVIAYVADRIRHPYAFTPDIAVDIGSVIEKKLDALHCHTSQAYEWLPYNDGTLNDVPAGESARREWLGETWRGRWTPLAERYRDVLTRWYGARRAAPVRVAEAFEVCEYGSQPNDAELRRLFPFYPAS